MRNVLLGALALIGVGLSAGAAHAQRVVWVPVYSNAPVAQPVQYYGDRIYEDRRFEDGRYEDRRYEDGRYEDWRQREWHRHAEEERWHRRQQWHRWHEREEWREHRGW